MQQSDEQVAEIDSLCEQAGVMAGNIHRSRERIVVMWAQAAEMFEEESSNVAAHPELRAEYILADYSLHDFMRRSIDLGSVPERFRKRLAESSFNEQLARFDRAVENVDPALVPVLVGTPWSVLQSDLQTTRMYLPRLRLLQCSAIVAIYGTVFYIEDVLSAYLDLDRPHQGWEVTRSVLVILGRELIVGSIPVLGPVASLIEKALESANHRYEAFKKGSIDRTAFLHFGEHLQAGLSNLAVLQAFMKFVDVASDVLDQECAAAMDQGTGILKIVGKLP